MKHLFAPAIGGVVAVAMIQPMTANAQVVEAVSTAATIAEIKGVIDSTIDKATNAGNFLVFKAATEAKSVIDTWVEGNKALMNVAFDRLNESQRQFFANLRAQVAQLNGNVTQQMEAATRITELANQTVQDARIFDGKLGVLRYSPRVFYPEVGEVTLTIRGVNFDAADPQLALPDGKMAKRVGLTRQEANFVVPADAFKYDPVAQQASAMTLHWLNPSDGFWGTVGDFFGGRRTPASTQIALRLLPQQMGTYTLEGATRGVKRDNFMGSREFHWSGRNETHTDNQGPHDNGWKFQIASLRMTKSWGEAGKGCHVVSSNEYGFSIEVRTGKISTLFNPNAPGYQHCIYAWTEFKESDIDVPYKGETGVLGWKRDIALGLPANHRNTVLRVKLFDGSERVAVGTDAAQPYFEVIESGDTLLVKPKLPTDIAQ